MFFGIFFDVKIFIKFIFYFAQYFVIKILFCIFFLIIYFFLTFIKLFSRFTGRFAPDLDPLLSASNKSGQKCLSAHFAISNNVSLCSPLVKFEAEPNFLINEKFLAVAFFLIFCCLNFYIDVLLHLKEGDRLRWRI